MSWLENLQNRLYDYNNPPPDNSAVNAELLAQGRMSPKVRQDYYAGSQMPLDPRAAAFGKLPDPRPADTFAARYAPMGEVAAQDSLPDSPFERAAMRQTRPYRAVQERAGTSNMGPIAESLAPDSPLGWGLMFAAPGTSLVGRVAGALPKAARMGSAALGALFESSPTNERQRGD